MPKRLRLVTNKEQLPPAAEWLDPALLHPWKDNPRDNEAAVPKVMASIQMFGFGAPIVARRLNREIIAGETRWKAATKLGLKVVPVRLLDISEEAAHQLALADNKLGELSKWQKQKVKTLLQTYDPTAIAKFGWTDSEMKAVHKAATVHSSKKPDKVSRLPAKAVIKPGDTWLLGKHRLVCGNIVRRTDVAKALGGFSPFMMVSAPPHDANLFEHAMQSFGGAVAYLWQGTLSGWMLHNSLIETGFDVRQELIWLRTRVQPTKLAYVQKHEGCWYAVRQHTDALWCGAPHQTTAFEASSDDGRPGECYARPIRNHGTTGTVVYDPFAGSGGALVASEELGRVCVAIEADPALCDIAVDRWQRLAGGHAKRA